MSLYKYPAQSPMAHEVLLFPEGQEVQPEAETLSSLQSFEREMGIVEGDDEGSVTVETVCSRVISVMGVLHCSYSYTKIRSMNRSE
ncbi:hypothetical protein KOW79_008887 [Hemibagrus wyckioides]|uniref:Uncharacterized protein n=1 Tax=Hemibagrus wyckioides TaxID=337641 RepID=A0A9D3NPM4_9TELE|nr:hypothetical protein KOW79_008887 [Hemibagrus wyckioides]